MAERTNFPFYLEWEDSFAILDDEQKGRLITALIQYAKHGTTIEMEQAVAVAFVTCKRLIDKDAKRYADKCEARRAAANARWCNANDANASNCNANDAQPQPQPQPQHEEKDVPNGTSEKKNPPMKKPSLEEVVAYMAEIGGGADEAQKYIDYYSSNGWKVGRNTMKDWKAAARNWVRNKKAPANRRQTPMEQLAQMAGYTS